MVNTVDTYITFEEFLQRLRALDNTSLTDKGRKFEQAIAALLPQICNEPRFDKAWLWQDWPDREEITDLSAQDIGIDVVARRQDTQEYWAVQCKFYDTHTQVTQGDLGTFYALSGRKGFSGRLIISTTDNWTKNAGKMVDNQQLETKRLRLQDLCKETIKWHWDSPEKTTIHYARKTLYPLQEEAFSAAKKHFAKEGHERGQLIMACGTGKTFTSLKIAEELVPDNGSVLFCVPSLSLLKQTLTEWSIQKSRPHRYLAVCSDRTVARGARVNVIENEEDVMNLADIPAHVTTDSLQITNKLEEHKSTKQNAENDKTPSSSPMHVVFSTYQSLESISRAKSQGGGESRL